MFTRSAIISTRSRELNCSLCTPNAEDDDLAVEVPVLQHLVEAAQGCHDWLRWRTILVKTLTPRKIVAPDPNGSQTIDIMLSLLTESFGIDKQQLALDQPLDSLGLDSLAFVEYLFELEKALNITLTDVPRDVETVGALVAFIDSEAKRQSRDKIPT